MSNPYNPYSSSYPSSPPSYIPGSYVPTPPSAGGGGGYIEPGSLVYTTMRYDGQILYCVYKAEPSSYQTAQGPVHGIQWLLLEVSPVLPVNLPPADRDFFAAWGPNGEKERQRMVEKWQHEQQVKRGPVKYSADWERDRRDDIGDGERRGRRISSNQTYGAEYPPYTRARSKSYSRYERADEELARAMDQIELDRGGGGFEEQRQRRRSVSRGPHSRGPSPNRLADYATSNAAPPYTTKKPRKKSVSYPTAAEYSTMNYGSYASPPSPRGGSPYMTQGALPPANWGGPVYPPGHILAGKPIPGLQPGDTGGGGGGGSGATVTSYRAPSPRPGVLPNYRSSSPRPEAMYRSSSPRPEVISYRSSSPRPEVISYRSSSPRPEVMSYRSSSPRPEVVSYRSSSRAPSPRPRDIDPPASFSRPPSMAFPYTYFDPILIAPDLNRLHKEPPALLPVLVPHDVHHDDWNRCINDILVTWFRNRRQATTPPQQTSIPASISASTAIISKKPATVVAQLIDIWNASFFAPRGVELMLYRGRQRCSGPQAGRYDASLGILDRPDLSDSDDFDDFDDDDDDDSSDLSTLSSGGSAENYPDYFGYGTSRYGPAGSRWMAESREAQRARKEAKRLRAQTKKKQRQLQLQQRQREKERRRKEGLPYTLYLGCIGDGQPPRVGGAAAAYTAAITGARY